MGEGRVEASGSLGSNQRFLRTLKRFLRTPSRNFYVGFKFLRILSKCITFMIEQVNRILSII